MNSILSTPVIEKSSLLSKSEPLRNKKSVSDGVVGMIFLLSTEIMFFAGLISAYIVNKAGAIVWPAAGQPRLPIEITAINTAILLCSAIAIFIFGKKFKQGNSSLKFLLISILLGTTFVLVQGTEWIKLIGFGLTTTSSLFGAFFYLIIGAHALHAMAGLAILFYLYFKTKNNPGTVQSRNSITICSMYWYFVVGIWPVLYTLVYLL